LKAAGSPDAVLMPTEGTNVIEGCDRAFVDELVNLAYAKDTPPASRAKIRLMLGEMVTLSVDPEGRFVFPAALREHAKLEDSAVFVGQGRTFRIVNPTTRTALRDEEKAKVGAQNLSLTSLFDEGVV
jgi:MraZ protein